MYRFQYISVVTCSNPGPGINANLVNPQAMYSYGDVVNYICTVDDATVCPGSLSINCTGSGEWTDDPPTCSMYKEFLTLRNLFGDMAMFTWIAQV